MSAVAGPSDLFLLADEWLGVCASAVATTVGGPIAFNFVSPGPPTWDCCDPGLLAVYVGSPAEGDTAPLSPPLAPGHRLGTTGAVHLINLTCVVLRCSPVPDERGAMPSATALSNAAQRVDEDVWAIWQWTKSRYKDGSLFASGSGHRELTLDPAFAQNPEGGCAGWQIPIRVQLGGYNA